MRSLHTAASRNSVAWPRTAYMRVPAGMKGAARLFGPAEIVDAVERDEVEDALGVGAGVGECHQADRHRQHTAAAPERAPHLRHRHESRTYETAFPCGEHDNRPT